MSIDAGWTHFGSNGSIPMRPESIAARMSRSERTTTTEYAGLRPTEREHRVARLAPCAHAAFRVRQRRTREAPQDLDGVRAGRLTHLEIGRTIADHHGFLERDAEPAHRVLRQVGRWLRARGRVPAEIEVDVPLDAESAQDPLAIGGPLTGDR